MVEVARESVAQLNSIVVVGEGGMECDGRKAEGGTQD